MAPTLYCPEAYIVDQVAQGAAEPVEFPDDQGVAGPQLVQDLLEDGPVGRAPLAVSVNTR